DHFGRRMALELEWDHWPGFSRALQEKLIDYQWPGNVRELRNVIERAVYRWGVPDAPIDDVQFDPFASPWAPQGQQQLASLPLTGGAAPVSRDGAESEAADAIVQAAVSQYDPTGCADFRLAI